jgi:hypothetical protein
LFDELHDEFSIGPEQTWRFYELMGRLAVIDATYRAALAPESTP